MAHNFTSGCFYRDQAWHGLGVVVQDERPVTEMFQLAEADFTADASDVYISRGDHVSGFEYTKIPGYKAITHSETGEVLSIQSDEYNVIPNDRLIWLAEAMGSSIQMLSVAVMGGGRRVAFSARIRSLAKELAHGEMLHMKLSGVNSFDGSQAFTVLFDPTRIVCDNTLGWSIQGADRRRSILRVTHNAKAEQIIQQLPKVMNLAEARFTSSVEEVEAMIAKPCDTELFKRMLEITFEKELATPINDVRGDSSTARQRLISDLPGYDVMCNHFAGDLIGANKATEGTIWGAFNSISEFYRHQAYRGGKNAEARRFGSLQFGINQDRIQRARAAALSLTRA